jgi:prepilin-type N-terminal cleavage/methylation domain-containing protein
LPRPEATAIGHADERGRTLLELLLALALFSVLVGGILVAWRQSQEAYFHGAEAAQVQQNARAALEQMIREIREARGITTAEANRLAITSVLDESTRTYELSGSASPSYRHSLLYTKPGPPGPNCTTPCPIADYLVAGGLQFAYRDAAGTLLAAPVTGANRLLIRQIDVSVQVQTALADASPPTTFASSAKLRNR